MAGTRIASLFTSLTLENSNFISNAKAAMSAAERMSADISKSMNKLGGQMQMVGAGLSASLTLPLLAFAKGATSAATESRQAFGQVTSALASMGGASGKTAEELQASAKALMAISTFDDDDILRKVTANLLTFGNVAGTQFDRAQLAAVNLSARFGTDLQSAALQLGKALNDPVKGLTALSRAGVSFTEQQKAQITAMTEAGNLAGAQNIILAEMEKQFGGAAKALRDATPGADTKQQWADFNEIIGEIVLKALPPLTNALTAVLSAFNGLSPATQNFVVVGAAVAAALGPLALGFGTLLTTTGALLPLLLKIGPAFVAIAGFISTALVPALAVVSRALLAMLISTGPIGWLVLALGAVVTVWRNWSTIGPIVQNLYTQVKTYLVDKMGAVFTWLEGKLKAVGGFFFKLYDAVVGHSYVPDLVDGVRDHFARLDEVMVQPAASATERTRALFEAMAGDVERSIARMQTGPLAPVGEGGVAAEPGLALGGGDIEGINASVQAQIAPTMAAIHQAQAEFEYLADGIAGSFAGAFDGILTGTKSIGAAAMGVLRDLQQEFIRAFVTKPLFGLIKSGLSAAFGGGFAKGGILPTNKVSLVGENGPELVRPGGMGLDVIPNHKLGDVGGGSGGGLNMNASINVYGAMDDRSARHTGKQIAAGMQAQAMAARRQGIAA
jgi:hypothetical protein